MENINKNELSQELIQKAMNCETAEELIELAKSEGIDLTKDQAEAYLAEFEEIELDLEDLEQVAAGVCPWNHGSCKKLCVTGDTLLMLEDGSEKRVDQLDGSEYLMTWDFDKGMAVGRKMFFLHKGTYDEPTNVLRVKFNDGTTVGVLVEHLFFDMTLGKFIAINENKIEENRSYIGHEFAKVSSDGKFSTVKLVDITIEEKAYEYYAPIAEEHWSHMVNGMFSGCAYTLGMVNRFDFVKGELRYDAQKKAADLANYAILPYEVVAEYMSYEFYKKNRGYEMSVAIAKGLLTKKELIGLIDQFMDCFYDSKKINYTVA